MTEIAYTSCAAYSGVEFCYIIFCLS